MSVCLLGSDGSVALGRDGTAERFRGDFFHGPTDPNAHLSELDSIRVAPKKGSSFGFSVFP